jgi:hypothetical protein
MLGGCGMSGERSVMHSTSGETNGNMPCRGIFSALSAFSSPLSFYCIPYGGKLNIKFARHSNVPYHS